MDPQTQADGPRGLIFDIQGHSVHDGPGTRTTVFLGGCPLHCTWCCNPEGIFTHPVLLHHAVKCKRCGACAAACTQGAVTFDLKAGPTFDRAICDRCTTFECTAACVHEGVSVSGKYWTVPELLRILKRDSHFWGSKGGVTFSGGEPLMQYEFMQVLLPECKRHYFNVCLETSGDVPPDFFLKVLPFVDWIFIDIKHMDSEVHQRLTGTPNHTILENVRALAHADWGGFAVVRVPVVAGCNDSDENIRATARFVHEQGLELINLLPFHRLGESKYRQLGQRYEFAEQVATTEQELAGKKAIVESEGVACYLADHTPF